MIDPNIINDLSDKLAAALPAGVQSVCEDAKKNFQSVLQATLGKMDLVTREEFDAQVQVLRRTRQKLEELQAKLDKLESSGK